MCHVQLALPNAAGTACRKPVWTCLGPVRFARWLGVLAMSAARLPARRRRCASCERVAASPAPAPKSSDVCSPCRLFSGGSTCILPAHVCQRRCAHRGLEALCHVSAWPLRWGMRCKHQAMHTAWLTAPSTRVAPIPAFPQRGKERPHARLADGFKRRSLRGCATALDVQRPIALTLPAGAAAARCRRRPGRTAPRTAPAG